MVAIKKGLKWIGLFLAIVLTAVFLVGAIMVSRSFGFGLHAGIYLGVSILLFLLVIYLVKKI